MFAENNSVQKKKLIKPPVVVSTTVDEKDKEKLKYIAEREGVTLRAAIKKILKYGLEYDKQRQERLKGIDMTPEITR